MGGIGQRERCVAIMAGGRGLRLWPVLLEQSLARAALLAPQNSLYVVTAGDLVAATEQVAPPGTRVVVGRSDGTPPPASAWRRSGRSTSTPALC